MLSQDQSKSVLYQITVEKDATEENGWKSQVDVIKEWEVSYPEREWYEDNADQFLWDFMHEWITPEIIDELKGATFMLWDDSTGALLADIPMSDYIEWCEENKTQE